MSTALLTAITYINAKTEPYVRPLAQALQSEIFNAL